MVNVAQITGKLTSLGAFTDNFQHALAHKALLTDELGDVLHNLTQHGDQLADVSPNMVRAAADDVVDAMAHVNGLPGTGYGHQAQKVTNIRNALLHAVGHLK